MRSVAHRLGTALRLAGRDGGGAAIGGAGAARGVRMDRRAAPPGLDTRHPEEYPTHDDDGDLQAADRAAAERAAHKPAPFSPDPFDLEYDRFTGDALADELAELRGERPPRGPPVPASIDAELDMDDPSTVDVGALYADTSLDEGGPLVADIDAEYDRMANGGGGGGGGGGYERPPARGR